MEDQEIVELLQDPVKFACVVHCLMTIKDSDAAIKEYGIVEVVKIACEATKEAFGGETP